MKSNPRSARGKFLKSLVHPAPCWQQLRCPRSIALVMVGFTFSPSAAFIDTQHAVVVPTTYFSTCRATRGGSPLSVDIDIRFLSCVPIVIEPTCQMTTTEPPCGLARLAGCTATNSTAPSAQQPTAQGGPGAQGPPSQVHSNRGLSCRQPRCTGTGGSKTISQVLKHHLPQLPWVRRGAPPCPRCGRS